MIHLVTVFTNFIAGTNRSLQRELKNNYSD